MREIFIPTANSLITRRRYLFSFIIINVVLSLIILFFVKARAYPIAIIFTLLLHYLIININCQRLRDSGFNYIKAYVFVTLFVYLLSIVLMFAEHFDCQGNGSTICSIWYSTTFIILLLAPTELRSN